MTPDAAAPRIQVKICGLTTPDQAQAIAALKPDAIGCVFFPPSPRNVSLAQARSIADAVDSRVSLVGVFVDSDYDSLMATVDHVGLDAVQLHGNEPPALVRRLRSVGVMTIKALFAARPPGFAQAAAFDADALLVECGRGPLPGGNAEQWDWGAAQSLGKQSPMLLAGGLDAANVTQAIAAAQPDAVDVSSGVEASPGVKDIDRVAAFIDAVRVAPISNDHLCRTVFSSV